MNTLTELLQKLHTDAYLKKLTNIYGIAGKAAQQQVKRYETLLNGFTAVFGDGPEIRLFSAPGRTELGGNHTDHQGGHVLAAGVSLDTIAAVRENGTDTIHIKSEGYDKISFSIGAVAPDPAEYNTTAALVKGVAAAFLDLGHPVKGFDCFITSNVLKGSGLSSSAAFEVLLGTILNHLFAGGKESAIKIAQIGQFAENVYFGKPSGLEDQMASSVGGFVTVDFKDAENPAVKKVSFDLSKSGYQLCICDAVGDHADLTPEYAAIPGEMKQIASYFHKNILSEVSPASFYAAVPALRQRYGDRAVLRAYHYFQEDARVLQEVEALTNGDFEAFRQLVNASGRSSFQYLQNIYASKNPKEQCLAVALATAEKALKQKGACRVHGGGFAGTIQAFVPNELLADFRQEMEAVFGENTCHVLTIRPVGGTEL